MLFHVDKETEYFVESNGVRSPSFSMTVLDLPTVDKLVLEYRFPAYTGLEPRMVDPGGDVAAIHGTEVRLHVTPTMKTTGGRVMLNDSDTAALEVQADGTLAGSFKVDERLASTASSSMDRRASSVNASPQYTIDVLDRSDAVGARSRSRVATRPRRPSKKCSPRCAPTTTSASSRCRCSTRSTVDPRRRSTCSAGAKALPEVTASHTIYLEELGLQAG